MRYQGKITNWKDEQGFGFVTPNGGGQKAFLHVKAFSNKSHRPIENDIVTYELVTDERGRYVAKNIQFTGKITTTISFNKSSSLYSYFAVLFAITSAMLALMGRLPIEIVAFYLVLSIVTFIVYAMDKSAAQNNRWRTKESTLHLLSLVGGWPGALIAQKALRHKSTKQEFRTIFWVTVITNCFTLFWLLLTKGGSAFLSSIPILSSFLGHVA